jgi:hypothetical protein
MENWGLITFREALLLYDPAHSSASNQYSVASVIAHELVSQDRKFIEISKQRQFFYLSSSYPDDIIVFCSAYLDDVIITMPVTHDDVIGTSVVRKLSHDEMVERSLA